MNLIILYYSYRDFYNDPAEIINRFERAWEKSSVAVKGSNFYVIGYKYFEFGFFELSIAMYSHASEYYIKSDNKRGQLNCYNNIGIIYNSNLCKYDKSLEYKRKALTIAKETDDKEGKMTCYNDLGSFYINLNDYNTVIENCNKALTIAEEIDNKEGKIKCYSNLGVLYHDLSLFTESIGYQKKALEIAEEIDNKEEKARCHVNYGTIYISLNDYNAAIENYKKGSNNSQRN